MHVPAAQVLRRHLLAGRRLHQRRPGEKDRPLLLHDDRHVRHRRHIGAARRARPHHHRDLRDPLRRHLRLVVEDPPEMLPVGKHLVLVRQVRPARIDQVDAGQRVLRGDLLRPQVLLHRHRIVGAALHRGVVRHHHHLLPGHPPDRRRSSPPPGASPWYIPCAAVAPISRNGLPGSSSPATRSRGSIFPRARMPRRRLRPAARRRRHGRRLDLRQRRQMRLPVGAERLRPRRRCVSTAISAPVSPSSSRMSRISRSRKKLITERISTSSPRNSRSESEAQRRVDDVRDDQQLERGQDVPPELHPVPVDPLQPRHRIAPHLGREKPT